MVLGAAFPGDRAVLSLRLFFFYRAMEGRWPPRTDPPLRPELAPVRLFYSVEKQLGAVFVLSRVSRPGGGLVLFGSVAAAGAS